MEQLVKRMGYSVNGIRIMCVREHFDAAGLKLTSAS